MIIPIDIRLNAAHPELPLAEAVTFTGSPSTVLIRGVPPNCGRWAITAVSVAATFPDGSTTTRAAVQSANGVWVATLPATATSGRTANGLRILADGIDENGAAVTGYIRGVADFAVASLGITPAPAPGETSWQMLYFDATPATPRKGDVIRTDGDLKFYNGTEWLPFTDLSNYYTAEQVDEAIDKLAAYYITYNAEGAAFPTRAALLSASTYYSGGVVRTPTRNDYAVVLADEAHDGAEYRYIYAVADGETVGQWEAQYPIETNDYTALANKPQINGHELSGNKTGANLGLVDATNGVATGLVTSLGTINGFEYGLRFGSYGSDYAVQIVTRSAGSQTNWTATANLMVQKSKTGYAALLSDIPNVPSPSTSAPLMDGTGSAGSSTAYARGDHVHPSDSAKLDKSGGSVAKIEWVNSGQSNATLLITFANGKMLAFDYDGYSSDTVATRLWIAAQGFVNRLTSYFTAGNLVQLTQDGGIEDAGWTAGELARYSLVAKTIANGAVTLDDRAINAVAVSSSLASLTINFPTATSGEARDFGLRFTVASGITTAPQIVLPQGVTCENADGEAPEIGADGAATILYFTETASGVFLVKGEVVTAIS